MKVRKVIVTGILGQDGANMAEYLLRDPNCRVFGMMRRSANPNYENTQKFDSHKNFKFVHRLNRHNQYRKSSKEYKTRLLN